MTARKIALGLVAAAALVPALSNASSVEKTSLKACAKAFATSISSKSATAGAPAYKLAYHGARFPNSLSDYYPTEYSFELEALDASGAPIARAHCSADVHGAVTTLAAVPMQTTATRLASR